LHTNTGKPQHALAGKEVSRALAMSSVDPADCNSSVLHDLGEEEMSRLREAVARFDSTYDAVGKVRDKYLMEVGAVLLQ